MKTFIQHHGESIHGVLSGLDRVRFRGTFRHLSYAEGFFKFLCFLRVLLIHFKTFVDGTSRKLKNATTRLATRTPVGKVVYLAGSSDKEKVVRELIAKHRIPAQATGLIAILSSVEYCNSFELHKNAAAQKLEVCSAWRKCLHYYLYIRHPQLGWLHIRIMTWFPMRVQICLNGREWLARQLDAAGIRYEKLDNSFAWVADFAQAQALLDEQTRTDWPQLLSGLLREYHPEFVQLLRELKVPEYYWTTEQSEWATDVAFRAPVALTALYQRLVRHATENLSCPDVLRFLQQRLTRSGDIHGRFRGEVRTRLQKRTEGVRVKHSLGSNHLKMYDKFGQVLRIETTINNAEGLKVYRALANQPAGTMAWRPLRRSVADLHRRCQLAQKANEAYLEALAVVEVPEPLAALVRPVSQRVQARGRSYRGLNLLSVPDSRLLQAISRGEYVIAGFRNRDLRATLYAAAPTDAKARKQQSGRVTRLLMLLRAHGLIQKVTKSHRYKITAKGMKLASAISYTNDADLKTLSQTEKNLATKTKCSK